MRTSRVEGYDFMRNDLKEWLFSLNDLAKDIYVAEWRISDVLKKHPFSES